MAFDVEAATDADPAANPAHIRFARRIARTASDRHGIPLDEAQGAAFLGLCEAARRYSPELGDFRRFARPRIRGAIQDQARRWRFGARGSEGREFLSIYDRVDRDQDPTQIAATIAAHDEAMADLESADWLRRVLACLPRRHAELMGLMFFAADARSVACAAARMGLTVGRGFQIREESLGMIRENAARLGLLEPEPEPARAE